MSRRLAALCASILLLAALVGGAWRLSEPAEPVGDAVIALPVPPFPPRITDGSAYESCLTTLASDPASAMTVAEAWLAAGGGDGADHCRGLALVATGEPAAGADVLEQLAARSGASAPARALVLGQAVQARLMVGQAETAVRDATLALTLSPADTELMIMRAAAEGMMERYQDAVDDLTQALRLDATRADAFVARAVMRRRLNQLEAAQADVTAALTIDPDDADALLERGILRQRTGDASGARTDWERARGIDPNSTTADLAEQNLSLLEAGPRRQ